MAIESGAARLDAARRDSHEATPTLAGAARESAYSTDHRGRLVHHGKIANAGRPGAQPVARPHLHRKTCVATSRLASQSTRHEVSTAQIVQSVIDLGG